MLINGAMIVSFQGLNVLSVIGFLEMSSFS